MHGTYLEVKLLLNTLAAVLCRKKKEFKTLVYNIRTNSVAQLAGMKVVMQVTICPVFFQN